MVEDIWKQVKRKLEKDRKDGAHHSSTTETDEETTKTDAHTIHVPEPGSTWLDHMVDRAAEERKTKTLIQKVKQKLIADVEWPRPYDSERDYRREALECVIAINELNAACESGDSFDQMIAEHVLHTIDEGLLNEQAKTNKKEAFLHKAISAYLGFCKYRISLAEECGVPEELKTPIYKEFEDTYALAFKAVVNSVILRNQDTVSKIGRKEFKKLWDKDGPHREKSMKVIDNLTEAFAAYFKEATIQERANFNKIMHGKGMKELLETLEEQTGLKGYASEIPDYV